MIELPFFCKDLDTIIGTNNTNNNNNTTHKQGGMYNPFHHEEYHNYSPPINQQEEEEIQKVDLQDVQIFSSNLLNNSTTQHLSHHHQVYNQQQQQKQRQQHHHEEISIEEVISCGHQCTRAKVVKYIQSPQERMAFDSESPLKLFDHNSWPVSLPEDPPLAPPTQPRIIFTHKKQIDNVSSMCEEGGVDKCYQGHHNGYNLVLSFTENELEIIENRFMACLYSKLCKGFEQNQQEYLESSSNNNHQQYNYQTQQYQHDSMVYARTNEQNFDEYCGRNQTIEIQNVSNNQQQVSFPTTNFVNQMALSSPSTGYTVSQDSLHNCVGGNLSNNIVLPKKSRPLKRKKKSILTTTVESIPISSKMMQNNNGNKTLVPPSINTNNLSQVKVSKKRDRNNSVSDSPTKKKECATTSHGGSSSVYRGHVSHSNSFSKESPWQFHTNSEGKRNHSDNLVFFHFNPKKV